MTFYGSRCGYRFVFINIIYHLFFTDGGVSLYKLYPYASSNIQNRPESIVKTLSISHAKFQGYS